MKEIEDFGMRYLSGSLPPWFDKVWLSQETVALFKTKEKSNKELRPISMRNPLLKSLHRESFRQNRSEFTDTWNLRS